MKIYIGDETGNYYWIENDVLCCCPMNNVKEDICDTNAEDSCVVEFENIDDPETCREIEKKLREK